MCYKYGKLGSFSSLGGGEFMQPKNWLKSKKFWVVAGVILLLGMIGTATSTSNKTAQSGQQPSATEAPVASKYSYQVLSRQENKTVENIAVLISSSDTNAEAIAMDVKKTCKKPCNIDVYDDQKAYDLNAHYDKLMGESTTQPEDLTAWKQANYVYVGDHLVGSVDFETGSFNDYPFRDWYYKELKGEK